MRVSKRVSKPVLTSVTGNGHRGPSERKNADSKRG